METAEISISPSSLLSFYPVNAEHGIEVMQSFLAGKNPHKNYGNSKEHKENRHLSISGNEEIPALYCIAKRLAY